MEMQDAIYFECPYCGEKFNTRQKLSGHCGYYHKEELYNEHVRMPNKKSNRLFSSKLDITYKESDEYRSSHSNRCDICGKIETANTGAKTKDTPNRLCIDHDHGTSRFRGFLCVQCNRNLGWYDKYKDAIEKHYNFGNAPKFLHKDEGH